MSLEINEEKCSVCSAYLFPEDDVVYCPECGAPHHRECYNSLGHCGLRDFHGTENQYKKPENNTEQINESFEEATTTCAVCGERYNSDNTSCPACNAPNISKMGGRIGGHIVSIDLMGGVPPKTDLGSGVTAEEAKKFVSSNSHRYIPKFLKFKNGKKTSWNWLAFLTPCGWLFSRKMYLLGGIIGAIQIALSMLTVPFAAAANQLDLSAAKNSYEIASIVMDNISLVGENVIYLASLSSFLNLALSLFFAIFADYIYKNRVISSICEIKSNSDDIEQSFIKKGGVNFFAAVIAYFAINELPNIIAYTMGLL
ncbi:MAG: DUF2628 domain-containing protein [Clostridia bacterium]|nr:DUF2628 domain-containing protein [Clostridia bacterium]